MERFNLINSEFAEDPRDYDEVYPEVFVFNTRYSHIGKVVPTSPVSFVAEMAEEEKKYLFPLYMLSHGVTHLSMSSFHDKWDSGQVGWVYANPEFRSYVLDPEKACEEAVKELDAWVSGDVYDIIDNETNETYGPFYGYNNAEEGYNNLVNEYGNEYTIPQTYTKEEVLALLNMPREEALRQIA